MAQRLTTYEAAIAAARFSSKGMELETLPVTVEGAGHGEATQAALEIAKKRWPRAEFWVTHAAAVRVKIK